MSFRALPQYQLQQVHDKQILVDVQAGPNKRVVLHIDGPGNSFV